MLEINVMKVASYKKESDITYSLGATVTMEYLNVCPEVIEGVILHPKFDSEDTIAKINEICGKRGIPVETSEKPFNILSKKGNCFVIGVIRKQLEKISSCSHVVLVNPSDAGNMGTIIRTCAGFGIMNIAVITPAVDTFDPRTVRASMGARARVKMELFDDFEKYQARFPENKLYPFMLDGSTLLQKTAIEGPFSLIFGNEATGLPDSFQQKGQPVRIEHTHNIDSLNLPTAVGIAIYEATKSAFGAENAQK